MELGTLLFVLLILVCPLMMVWMMRGHGGHHGHGPYGSDHGHRAVVDESGTDPVAELRRRCDVLDAEIEQLEQSETKTSAGV